MVVSLKHTLQKVITIQYFLESMHTYWTMNMLQGRDKVEQVVLDLRPDQSYNGPPKRYIWLEFEGLMIALPPPVMWLHLKRSATVLYLWPFATSCSHMTAVYCVFLPTAVFTLWLPRSLNDHNRKDCKIGYGHLMTCLMTSVIYNHNSGLGYACKLRTTCLYF